MEIKDVIRILEKCLAETKDEWGYLSDLEGEPVRENYARGEMRGLETALTLLKKVEVNDND